MRAGAETRPYDRKAASMRVGEGFHALPKIEIGRGWNLGHNAGKRLWCV
jgi:hypothetical protein